jgi:UDP-GlcNAc:undecaprenyl-phosphate/decaprenyl-phosphate GlcNAc-1-phosphate transferase
MNSCRNAGLACENPDVGFFENLIVLEHKSGTTYNPPSHSPELAAEGRRKLQQGALILQGLAPLCISFLVTVTLMLVLRPVATQVGLVDVPGGRKSHSGEVPVIGGIAMLGGLVAAALAIGSSSSGQSALLVAAALMVIVGVLDDRFDLPPFARIVAHMAAAMTLVLASGLTVQSLGNLFGLGELDLGAIDFIFTVTAAIALINGFNMLDGLDGLAGGVALIALLGLSFYFLGSAGVPAAMLSLGLVGSVSAFLIFNLPARFNRPVLAFMGDAGSTLLGFILAGLALVAIQPQGQGQGLQPVVVLWLLPVPVLELFVTTIRRLAKGHSPLRADRGHFHHRLLDAGFSVRAIFILYLGISSLSAVAGLWMSQAGASEPFMFYSFVILSLVWMAGTHNASRLVKLLPASLKRGSLRSLRRSQRARASGTRN